MTRETVPWMLSRVDGAYYGKILICAPMYKGGGYNRPDLSHIPASAKAGGYNRPDFVSHTRVHDINYYLSSGHFFFCIYPF